MSHDLLTPPLPGYRLLDSGAGRKLEDLGGILVIRPCPQAVWQPRLEAKAWDAAEACCHRTETGGGYWEFRHGDPGERPWQWRDPDGQAAFSAKLRLTAFGHCGAFFEQEPIWRHLVAHLARKTRPRFANLFGYTGCASLAAAAAGAEVFHVDSAKGVLDWGRDNARRSGLDQAPIHWIQDDVRSFLRLAAKRDFRYDAILVDPPSWGHASHGRRKTAAWRFEDGVAELLAACRAALVDDDPLLIFTSHVPGVQQASARNLLQVPGWSCTSGELGIAHADDPRILPAGIYAKLRLSQDISDAS